jgi:hypothetical protein
MYSERIENILPKLDEMGGRVGYTRESSGDSVPAQETEPGYGTRDTGYGIGPAARVLVSFAICVPSPVQSFPRRRESTAQTIENAPPTEWIPAFAGMTSVS